MLNAMFKEIQEILGHEYGLFREFNPQILYSDEILGKYKHIGVLYLNNGNPNFIPDGASMTIYYTLALYMRVHKEQVTSDDTVNPLEKLSTEMTGEIYAENTTWTYILNVGLPYSDGTAQAGASGDFFYVYEIPITAVVTSGVLLSNNTKLQLTIGDVTEYLSSVVSVVEIPEVRVESATFLSEKTADGVTYGAGQTEVLPVAKSWGLRVIKLYRPDKNIDVKIKESVRGTAAKVKVVYQMGDETATTRYCYIHDATFANENGQAVVLTFTLSQAMRPL